MYKIVFIISLLLFLFQFQANKPHFLMKMFFFFLKKITVEINIFMNGASGYTAEWQHAQVTFPS